MTDTTPLKNTDQQTFRQHCREWLQGNLPPAPPVTLPPLAIGLMHTEQLDYLVQWQQSAYNAGLVGCDYPRNCGGGGHDNFQPIANEEMHRAKTPYFPNVMGLGMAAPTIFHHASDELKQRLLPKLFSAEEIWCQGFSEPGAGSDLASVQTFAAPKAGDEGKWIINGHKVWTSMAQFASWMILLARTDKSDKYNGLTYFVVPIKAALGQGVTVTPLIKASGETGFNEVIFENLEIDDAYRLDEVGKGWQVAMTTLTHERGAGTLTMPSAGGQETNEESSSLTGVQEVLQLARKSHRLGKRAIDDPLIRDQLIALLIRDEGVSRARALHKVDGLREHPGRIPMQGKLAATDLMQDAAALALEIEGASSSLYVADSNAPEQGRWPMGYINSFASTIAAGTNEIQRNILGERVLGMPKSK